MRTSTFAHVGKDVTGSTNVHEVLAKAGLDYTVHKEPIFLGGGTKIEGKVATVKDDGTPIGVVSEKYTLYQNEEAFDFVDSIPGIQFEKAGETHTGMVYMIGKLPELSVIGDRFTPHVIFQTSHNGLYTFRATICPLRIVCQNQFAWSFKQMRNTLTIQHCSTMPIKVARAQEVLADVAVYMSGFSNTAEELAMLKIGENTRYAIIDAFFDSAKEISERQKAAIEEQKAFFEKCYAEDDNANFRGTAWGLVNATSDFLTHKTVKDTATKNDSRFMKVTFDTTAMAKMLSLIGQAA